MGSDPDELAATLRELARLDPVELGLQAVLERIVQAAATGCGSTTSDLSSGGPPPTLMITKPLASLTIVGSPPITTLPPSTPV